MTKIMVKELNNENFRNYFVKSKSEFANEIWQKILEQRHRQQRTIKCDCNIWLSVVLNDERYFLRTYPNQPLTHKDECLFQNNATENNDDTFSMEIFSERKFSDEEKTRQDYVKSEEYKTHNTFYNFCIEVLKNAQAFAFNSANKNLDTFQNNLELSNFKNKIYHTEIKTKKAQTIKELVTQLKERNIYFSYGINYQTVDDFFNTNKFKIKINDEEKDIIFENHKIEYAIKRLQIFKNYIKPPYFYFLTTSYGKVVRLFLYPIDLTNNIITFIESEKERTTISNFVKQNKIFIKPISDEFNQLARKKNRPFFPLAYRPDMFIFDDVTCTIVEISGKMGEDYDELLEEKEKCYKELKNFKYIRIE